MYKFQPGGIFQRFNYNNIYQNKREDIKELQRALGVKDDGIIGRQTISALQNKVGTKVDGIWGKNSIAAANAFLNNRRMPTVPQMQDAQQTVNNQDSWFSRVGQGIKSIFNRQNESEIVPAAGMEDIPNMESQTPTNKNSFVESLSRAMSAFGMHNTQNTSTIEQLPERDMSEYDVVFPENWSGSPNIFNTLVDSYYDLSNRNRWKRTVSSNDDKTTVTNNYGEEVPQVNMNWNVSRDQIARALALMPELNENSAVNWTGSTYDQTWDKSGYKESNQNILTQALDQLPQSSAQMAVTSLTQPGRGSLGTFSYRTTPEGIEISDGYQFAASPSRLRDNTVQGEAYNEERLNMANNYRAANGTTQRYFVPWSAYRNIRENYK